MQLQRAERKRAKIKMALQGPSGSGKTMSALLLAFGLCGDWSKIAVIDTENHSAELYSNLGMYNVVNISAPFSPEKYQEAIKLCEQSGMEVIIADSLSHEWDGSGGILDIHGNMVGNSFTNWARITPRHNAFIQSILQSGCHFIGTIRSKQEYVLNQKDGKTVPEKVGLKGVARENTDYEFTLVLDIDIKHNATASKDRTGLFVNQPEFRVGIETGKQILQWCNSGSSTQSDAGTSIGIGALLQTISECPTVDALIALYKQQSKEIQEQYHSVFTKRRNELAPPASNPISQLNKSQSNGSTNNSTSS